MQNLVEVAASEVSKNFGKYSKKAKEGNVVIVTKNGKKDLVLMNFDAYESLITELENRGLSCRL